MMGDARAAATAGGRDMAMQCRALGYDRRSQLIGLSIAVGLPALAAIASFDRVGFLPLVLAVILPGPLILALAELRRRSLWPAEEVVFWFNVGMEAEWRRETGRLWPRNAEGAARWLAAHPDGTVAAHFRVSALVTAGRIEEARTVAASIPGDTPRELHRKLDLRMTFDARDGLAVDETAAAADDAARADVGSGPELLASHIARHASVVAQSHGRDGLAELAAARPVLGPMKGKWARAVWKYRLRFAIASFLVGAWILVAMALAGAAAGGVFWI